jgi:DNA-directed RNA polymerase subunit RPC12/RpoP
LCFQLALQINSEVVGVSYECPKCSEELKVVTFITNDHITGDDKDMYIRQCEKCQSHHLTVHIDASMSYGSNYFVFRVDLTNDEAKELLAVIEKCPDRQSRHCDCPAHAMLDKFDYANSSRRVVLIDDVDKWV